MVEKVLIYLLRPISLLLGRIGAYYLYSSFSELLREDRFAKRCRFISRSNFHFRTGNTTISSLDFILSKLREDDPFSKRWLLLRLISLFETVAIYSA